MNLTSRVEVITNYFKLIDKCSRDIEQMISPACRDWIKLGEKHKVTIMKKSVGDIQSSKRDSDKSMDSSIVHSNLENGVLSANPNSNVEHFKSSMSKPMNPYICCFKGTGEVDSSAEVLKNIITNISNASLWDKMFVEGKVIEVIDSHTEILYLKYARKTCLLTQFVDVVIICHWYRKRDGTFVVTGRSVDHPAFPPQTGCFRAEVYSSGYIISPIKDDTKRSTVTYISHLDLNGMLDNDVVRAKFINFLQESQPLNVYALQVFMSKKGHSY